MVNPPMPLSSDHVELHLLDGGSWTPLDSFFHAGAETKPYRMYDWAFYIHHPKLDRNLIWDVGMTSVSVISFLCMYTTSVGPRVSRAL
jgi:hypothetical protein